MSGQQAILDALKRGPKTNAELQELTYDHSGSVARYCARLISDGRIMRIDGHTGRGSIAIYALSVPAQDA